MTDDLDGGGGADVTGAGGAIRDAVGPARERPRPSGAGIAHARVAAELLRACDRAMRSLR